MKTAILLSKNVLNTNPEEKHFHTGKNTATFRLPEVLNVYTRPNVQIKIQFHLHLLGLCYPHAHMNQGLNAAILDPYTDVSYC